MRALLIVLGLVISIPSIALHYAHFATPMDLWIWLQPITFAKIAMAGGVLFTLGMAEQSIAAFRKLKGLEGGISSGVFYAFVGMVPWIVYAVEASRAG